MGTPKLNCNFSIFRYRLPLLYMLIPFVALRFPPFWPVVGEINGQTYDISNTRRMLDDSSRKRLVELSPLCLLKLEKELGLPAVFLAITKAPITLYTRVTPLSLFPYP